jgi:hypothetical protein
MKSLLLCAAALSFMSFAVPSFAQQTPSADIQPTMDICKDVIDREYGGDQSRRNQCVDGVKEFLKGLGAASTGVDPTISELVVALTELYREDPDCMIKDTELAQAIREAAALLADKTILQDLLDIADQIDGCTFEPTAALGDESASP